MTISFERALGIHPQAMTVRIQRAEVIANNLANADTPGFQARDLDFKAILNDQVSSMPGGRLDLEKTSSGHISSTDTIYEGDLKYRVPLQPSVDGNTVDVQQETVEFTKNVLDYQASFQFLSGRFKGMTDAIKGE